MQLAQKPTIECLMNRRSSGDVHSHRGYLRISVRPAGLGTPISSSLSNLPGRRSAESTASGLLVAAMTTT